MSTYLPMSWAPESSASPLPLPPVKPCGPCHPLILTPALSPFGLPAHETGISHLSQGTCEAPLLSCVCQAGTRRAPPRTLPLPQLHEADLGLPPAPGWKVRPPPPTSSRQGVLMVNIDFLDSNMHMFFFSFLKQVCALHLMCFFSV